jgi:hypothetical protein
VRRRLPFRGPSAPKGQDFPRRPRPAGGFVRPMHTCACGTQAPAFHWEILGQCRVCGSRDGPRSHELFLVPGRAPTRGTQAKRWPARARVPLINPDWRALRRRDGAA